MDMVRNVLTHFRAEGITVVVNSHHLDEIERVCTRFAFLRNGKMEAQETIASLNNKIMIARWAPGTTPDSDLLLRVVAECGVTLAEINDEHGKIALSSRQDAPTVIAKLTQSGISIEEIYFDREGLSELFRTPPEKPPAASPES
jgi:ABC-2 type transport system ATP-binding protein